MGWEFNLLHAKIPCCSIASWAIPSAQENLINYNLLCRSVGLEINVQKKRVENGHGEEVTLVLRDQRVFDDMLQAEPYQLCQTCGFDIVGGGGLI
jgi:hypothetical protein